LDRGFGGEEGFYEWGSQVKTLILLLRRGLFLGIQPLLINSTILNARVWPWFFHARACELAVIRSLSKLSGSGWMPTMVL
jgi:hypothetical protein